MSCEVRIFRPDRAVLGAKAWGLLHAVADTLEDSDEKLEEFAQLARDTIDLYPCHLCKAHARSACAAHLEALDALPSRRRAGVPARVVAVAWAAGFHACVTEHLDGDAVVSPASASIARDVSRLWAAGGAERDAAIACYIDNLSV
jgi:hypothetical protein